MARVELPQSKLRARRKQRRLRLIAVLGVGALLLAGAAAGASYLPFLQIKSVEVSGTRTTDPAALESYARKQIAGSYFYIFSKRNIFLYPRQQIGSGLLSLYPELRVADVHAVNFHSISIAVIERQQKALWCSGMLEQTQSCYAMDDGGLLYAHAPAPATTTPYVVYHGARQNGGLPAQFASPEAFRSLSALVDALSQTQVPGVAEVTVDGAGDANARFGNGFVLTFALAEAGGDVFERFVLALKSDPFKAHKLSDFSYLDLRFGDKLYYKLK